MISEVEDFQQAFSSFIANIEKKVDSKKGKRKAKINVADSCKNLIVNYLPPEVDELDLKALFSVVGEVEKVYLMRDMTNKAAGPGKSLGYGFVDYRSANDGERAVDIINGAKILNKTIKVSYSRPSSDDIKATNIYISGLPQSFTQSNLEDLFSNFGTIISSKIIEHQDGTGRNIAFVRFNKREEANNAIIGTNNTKPEGCNNTIQVRFSNTPNNRNLDLMKRRKLSDLVEFNGHDVGDLIVYVYNLNPDTDDNALWKLFGAFGAIKNAKAVVDADTQKCRGFGFVTMKHLEEAVQAVQTLDGYTHDNRVLQVSFKNKSKRGELDIRGLNLAEVTGTHTLYVYNINPETEDTAIWKLFGQFGAVKNVKVMREDGDKKSKGFAFITMKNFDEAADAIKVLNGFTLDNRVLQVSFKTQKSFDPEDTQMDEIFHSDIPSYIATDRFGCVQIFVYNLSPETEERNLWKLFGQFGAVKNVKVLEDKSAKFEYKGHSFVSMKDYKEASLAVGALNGTLLDGRIIQVSFKLKANNSI